MSHTLAGELPPILTRRALADLTGLSPKTLANLAVEGKGPRVMKPNGGRVVYLAADVAEWITGGAA